MFRMYAMFTNKKIKQHVFNAACAITALFSVACSPIKTLNAIIPENGYELHPAIAYGDLPQQKMDIYIPKSNVNVKRRVVVFFYGGSWDSGARGDYKFVAEALTSKGFIVAIPDYRVYPEVNFPGFMADPAKAAAWVKLHADELGGDAQHIFLAGHSAGAHIAVMLSVNSEYLAHENLKYTDFAGTIGLAGPYDFLPLRSQRLKAIFGPESERWKSQPIEFVSGKNPPILLLVGLKDTTVATYNTFNMANKIKSKGGPVKVVEFPTYSHIDMVAKLAKPLRGNGELLKPIVDFIQQQ